MTITAKRLIAWKQIPLATLPASGFLVFLLVSAIIPNAISATDPYAIAPRHAFLSPDWNHPFGTDQSGRDILTRVIHGTRQSLLVGAGAVTISFSGGIILGLAGGLGPRWLQKSIGAIIDVLFSFPALILALLFSASLGTGAGPLALAIGIAATPGYGKMVFSQVLSVRYSGYVEAARALGHTPFSIVQWHILPNALRPLVVTATMGVGQTIVWASGLSFLGLGAPPPTPEWGTMMSMGRDFIADAWWLTLFPGLFIVLTVLSTTIIGRFLQRCLEGRPS
ncbi:ABC transporter permease [Gluconobacter cerinus]|uniref:ABC transporter permease n=1 Tax=Gluconobacter TaxID=441 RepID=UPI001B8C30E5|nr:MULTISPECIES: ABC transporter permease [Gluconobacter]MBS0994097.1 ABC transporter permease [Gluconobacter cerinus]MBS1022516.1 ABC transporter permease [Gluconobacter cerinus]